MHYALLLAAFASLWTFRAGSAVVAAPAASGSNVVVADTQGDVFALVRATGKVRWSTIVGNGVWSAPIVFGNRVIVSTGDHEFVAVDPPMYAVAGAHPSGIVALDKRTGGITWEYDLAGSGAPAPALSGSTLIHHDGSSEVLALDAHDGAYRWRTFAASTAAWNAGVTVGSDRFATSGMFPNSVLILRVRDGVVIHRISFPPRALGFAQARIATDGKRIYGTYFLTEPLPVEHLYAVDVNSARVLWDHAVDQGANAAQLPQLTVRGGIVYAGSPFRNMMQAFRAANGTKIWEAALRGRSVGGAVIQNDTVYAADGGGMITMLDAQTGAVRGSYNAGSDMQDSTPAIIGDMLVVGSANGTVHSIPLAEIRP
ncbi:MAG TPA: PQQ-binding-like beta-propeller repeat protein [Candidatus Baltobacteraceae bacterium]|nr:PQQ-binding-like beta-propeller repeat protein [Candidatus Baltobacteraceae bacterium]